MKVSQRSKELVFGLPGLIALMILMWGTYWLCVAPSGATVGKFPRWEEAGQFGDSFGSLTCLFSAITLAVLIYGLYSEHRRREADDRIQAFKEMLTVADNQYRQNRNQLDLDRVKFFERKLAGALFSSSLPDRAIVSAFEGLGFNPEDFSADDLERIRIEALYEGIVSVEKLDEVLREHSAREFVKDLYKKELSRSPDPSAFLIWGSRYLRGNKSEEAKNAILSALKTSFEWNEKNSGKGSFAAPPDSR